MKIGIDVSQVVYEGTGVARYVRNLTLEILRSAPPDISFVLLGASRGRKQELERFFKEASLVRPGTRTVLLPVPVSFLDFLWNTLHIVPVERFTGPVDVFWSSDWVQPPLARARGITTVHDVSFLRFPESFESTIPSVQKRRLKRVAGTCERILCDSESTARDVVEYLHISPDKVSVVYPGYRHEG